MLRTRVPRLRLPYVVALVAYVLDVGYPAPLMHPV